MARKKERALCEATRTEPAEVSIESDDPNYPFQVCNDVASRLKACALTPLEFYRLVAIHGRGEFWLHDDFYDDDGIAQQPGVRVPKKKGERMPKIQEIRNNLEDLLDYYFSQPEQDEPSLQLLAQFDKSILFSAVERRLGNPPRKGIEGRAYLIFQRLLPQQLAASLEKKWNAVREDGFGSLGAVGELAAASVPAVGITQTLAFIRRTVERLKWPDETREHAPVYYFLPFYFAFHLRDLLPGKVLVDLLLEFMDKLPPEQRASMVLQALSYVCDERVLDWIERNAVPPITYEWGTATACNQPSWKRLARWLDKGRPLSLIALDALKNCRGYDPTDDDMSGLFQTVSPKVRGPVSLNTVRKKLKEYLRVDPAPRVKKVVAIVLGNLEKTIDEFTP
jgi:hypothetical protein